jgi:hypothetical protein
MLIAVGIIVAGIVLVLGAEVLADRAGESRRPGRLARLAIVLFGLVAVYWVLRAR